MVTRWGASASSFSRNLDEMAKHFVEVNEDAYMYYDYLKANGIPTMCDPEVESSNLYDGPSANSPIFRYGKLSLMANL